MPYRNPDPARMAANKQTVFQFAGQTATLQSYVSSSPGVPAAGIPAKEHFTDRPIWALFGREDIMEVQTPAGMVANAVIQVTTHEQLDRKDRLVWRGNTYEIDSDPVPARIGEGWISIMKRVST